MLAAEKESRVFDGLPGGRVSNASPSKIWQVLRERILLVSGSPIPCIGCLGAPQEDGVFNCPVETFALKLLPLSLSCRATLFCDTGDLLQSIAALSSFSLHIAGMQANSGIHFCLPEALMLDTLLI